MVPLVPLSLSDTKDQPDLELFLILRQRAMMFHQQIGQSKCADLVKKEPFVAWA